MYWDIYEARIKGFGYAAEPEKYVEWVDANHVLLKGHHAEHTLTRVDGVWLCNCDFFNRRVCCGLAPYCCHTIAVERASTTRVQAN